MAGLTEVSGVLYGTTYRGGTSQLGTVYSVSTSGTERVLYRFTNRPDVQNPAAALINVKGTLYGTTAGGGKYALGTVFGISMSGTEHVLHSFTGYVRKHDGYDPQASLCDVKGWLFSTTAEGGKYYHDGTAFKISTSGDEKVLFSFNIVDGYQPFASLIDHHGTLYGTTVAGGKYNPGTIFSISTTGTEHVLHSFGSGDDGAYPYAGLIKVNGTLYGTTSEGGTHGGVSGGWGTVFALRP